MIFCRNVICSDIKADAGCLTEKACMTHGDPGCVGVKRYCWTAEEQPKPRCAVRLHALRLPLNNSCVIFLTGLFLPGNLCKRRFPLFVLFDPFHLHYSISFRCNVFSYDFQDNPNNSVATFISNDCGKTVSHRPKIQNKCSFKVTQKLEWTLVSCYKDKLFEIAWPTAMFGS